MNHLRRPWRSLAAPLLLAVPLLLAGCGSTADTTAPVSPSMAGMSMAPGQVMAPEGSTSPAGGPPATALMVCSQDISSKVVQVLSLDAPPPTRSAWDGSLYTCAYDLPMGAMVLSVQVRSDKAAAGAAFDADRTRRGQNNTLPGLGERAFGTPDGVTVVLKDDQVLTVDATALPEVFGSNDQHRTDLANEIASDVLGCWTGDE
jgi:hypothetical protein